MFRLFEHFWLFWNFNRSQNPRFQTTTTIHWWICSIFAYSSSQPCHPVCWIYASQSKLRTLFDLPIVQGCGSEQRQWPQGVRRGLYASDKYHRDWDQEWNISPRIILECRCTNRCCTPQGKSATVIWSKVMHCDFRVVWGSKPKRIELYIYIWTNYKLWPWHAKVLRIFIFLLSIT